MNARVLEPSEWSRVEAAQIPDMLMYCEPQNVDVVVVEDEGEIKAAVTVLRVSHFEGLWIKPEERGNAGVFRALIERAYTIPRGRSERWTFGGAASGDSTMEKLCTRLGGHPMAVKFFALPVGE